MNIANTVCDKLIPPLQISLWWECSKIVLDQAILIANFSNIMKYKQKNPKTHTHNNNMDIKRENDVASVDLFDFRPKLN